jgi:hypothetical protein
MSIKQILAFGGATAVVLVGSSAAAMAAGTKVTVRVEGAKHTLVPSTPVHTHAGWITKGGTPRGKCSATTAAGALDVATHHHWGGTYDSSQGLELTSIKGETYTFSNPTTYWGIWVNNKFAQFGLCGLKLKRGEQILFAPAPDKGNVFPAAVKVAKRAKVGQTLKLTVVYYDTAGKAKPLAGAHITGASGVTSKNAVTSKSGVLTIKPEHTGKLKLVASEKGYIRSAAVSVTVS